MSLWQTLEDRNPMLAETRLATRRALGMKQKDSAVWPYLIAALGFPGVFVFFAARFPSSATLPLVYMLTAIIGMFTVIGSLHGVIAKEREKRSFEVLMMAPLSAKQMLFGKMARCLIGLIYLQFSALVVALAAVFGAMYAKHDFPTPALGNGVVSWLVMMVAILVLWFESIGITMMVTAKAKRVYIALMTSFIWHVVVHMIVPMLVAFVTFNEDFLEYISIFATIQWPWQPGSGIEWYAVAINLSIHTAIGAGCLWLAYRRLLKREVEQD